MLCLVSRLFRVTDSLFSPNFDIHISLHHHRPPTRRRVMVDGGRSGHSPSPRTRNLQKNLPKDKKKDNNSQQPSHSSCSCTLTARISGFCCFSWKANEDYPQPLLVPFHCHALSPFPFCCCILLLVFESPLRFLDNNNLYHSKFTCQNDANDYYRRK